MISDAQILLTLHHLAAGRSQRETARLVGISRGSVGNIQHGRLRPRGVTPDAAAQSTELRPFSGPPAKCPTCGARVYLPCLACRVRRLRDQRNGPAEQAGHPIHLELRPDDLRRYRQVVDARRRGLPLSVYLRRSA